MAEFLSSLQIGHVLAFLGMALAALLAGMGSARGVGLAGEALAGVVAEDPDSFGKCLTLQVLPGTQGIYGFMIAFMVMIRLNVLGGALTPISGYTGFLLLLGCLPIAIVGYFSAVNQGRAAAAAIALVGRRPDQSGKGMTLTVLVETYAVLALLASFLMVFFVPMV